MIGTVGWQQLLIILVILALLFGANRVSSLGGALGKGIREFRSEARAEDPKPEDETVASSSDSETPSDSTTPPRT